VTRSQVLGNGLELCLLSGKACLLVGGFGFLGASQRLLAKNASGNAADRDSKNRSELY